MQEIRHIRVGRHDDNFLFLKEYEKGERVRIGSENPNALEYIDYSVISTDGKVVLYEGVRYGVVEFFDIVQSLKLKNIIVLTVKERELILRWMVDFCVEVHVLEERYPIFGGVKYVSNLPDNINEAKKRLNEIKVLGIKGGGLNKWLSTYYRHRQERKIRFKSSLDSVVYFSCLPPYQEVFKAKEARPDRLIYALDFNSMYAACMQGDFPSPKHLRHIKFEPNTAWSEGLSDGFYRVILIGAKDGFFLKNHPFRYAKSNKSYAFNLLPGDSVEIFLPRDEVSYYSVFFNRIEIVEGLVSTRSIKHPLSLEVDELYQVRKAKFVGQSKRRLAKISMTVASSVSNPRRYYAKRFKSLADVLAEFERVFSVRFDNRMPVNHCIEMAKSGGRLFVSEGMGGDYYAKIFKIDNLDSIYTLYSKVVSNSRIRMLSLLERLMAIESLELCYANVDSLHVSINRSDRELLDSLLFDDLSGAMGGLKVEAVATSGYWSDLGRYWLISSGEVVKYSNVLFSQRHSTDPFVNQRLFKRIHSIFGFRYVESFLLDIKKTFSYKKKLIKPFDLDSIFYERYDYADVFSASAASSSVSKEMLDSYKIKSSLFDEVSAVQCSSNATHNF